MCHYTSHGFAPDLRSRTAGVTDSGARRSGDNSRRHVALALLAFAIASCGRSPESPPEPEKTTAVECSTTGLSDAKDAGVFAEMRRAFADAPAYSVLARQSPLRSCRGTGESGEVSLEFAFANGDTLSIVRDAAIESSQQEARFSSPRDLPAVELLRQIERATFAPDGCGVDWNEATTVSAPGDPNAEVAYYGETCNCQARIRTDRSGQVVGFVFRSAC